MKILPPKQETKEPEIPVKTLDEIHRNTKLDDIDSRLDELDDLGIDEDEERKVLESYRQKRIAELKAQIALKRFGSLREVSKSDWVDEVNNEDSSIYVVIHIAKHGVEMCSLMDKILRQLAAKFVNVKFLRGESTTCIPDYPDSNLPTLFVYKNGDMVNKLIGPSAFGCMKGLTSDSLEWNLAKMGVLKTDLHELPEEYFNIKTIKGGRIGAGDSSDSD